MSTTIGSYTVFWGPLRLYVDDVTTDGGRHQVTHEPARGDAYVTQDKGRVLRKVRTTLSFFDVSGEVKSGRERYEDFVALVDSGAEYVFVHPFHGSFLAVVGPYTEDIRSDADVIRVSCEFIPAEPFEPVSDVGAGALPAAGPESVTALATEAATALEAAGIESDLPAETAALAASWAAEVEADSRRVYLEAAAKVAEIDAFITEQELSALDAWQAYRSVMTMRDKLISAAESMASEVTTTFDYVVNQPVPLLSVCARLYGALEAPNRARQVTSINDLRNTLLLKPGRYKFPLVGDAR